MRASTAFHGKRCGSESQLPEATTLNRLCVLRATAEDAAPATAEDAVSAAAGEILPSTAALALHFGTAVNNKGSAGCTVAARYGLVGGG